MLNSTFSGSFLSPCIPVLYNGVSKIWNLTPLLSIFVCSFTAWVVNTVLKPSNNKGSDIVLLSSALLWCVLTLKGHLKAHSSGRCFLVVPQYQELQLACPNQPHLVACLLPSAGYAPNLALLPLGTKLLWTLYACWLLGYHFGLSSGACS